jgi:hypothetical protein
MPPAHVVASTLGTARRPAGTSSGNHLYSPDRPPLQATGPPCWTIAAQAAGLVGADKLPGLAGATADGGTWTVCSGSIRTTPRSSEIWR